MDEIDVNLPNTLKSFINQFLRIMGTLIIVTYTFPSIVFTIIPITLGVIWLLETYLKTSRNLRRSASATMALVNGHMSETMRGVSTIRTYKIQNQVIIYSLQAIRYILIFAIIHSIKNYKWFSLKDILHLIGLLSLRN